VPRFPNPNSTHSTPPAINPKLLRYEVDPEQCVAVGAAIQAGLLLGLTSGVELMDGSYVEELHQRSSGFQV
jgi:hypothetical protein